MICLLFISCHDEKKFVKPIKTSHVKIEQEPLQYLNEHRNNSGLVSFKQNSFLTQAAKNHAIYEAKNTHQGHDEDNSNAYFTGENPQKRALKVGYESKMISENISYKKDLNSCIDSLFTAIYHRFGFLDFSKDEVGFFIQNEANYSSCVFVMGNSKINEICKNGGDKNPQRFYKNICKDKNIKIDEKHLNDALDFDNPSVVLFPSDDEQEAMVYFSGETPDPMPKCKILSNPVSISFAPHEKNIVMKNFKLFSKNKEIEHTKIITKQNDINKKFAKNQFALFSLKPFKFATNYRVVFEYSQEGLEKKIEWNFRTKEPENDYFYIKNSQTYGIKADTYYDIFFEPETCNDILEKYSYTSLAKVSLQQIGTNFLRIKASGFKYTPITFKTNNRVVTFILTTSSKDVKKYKYYGFILLILAIIVALFIKGKY